MGSLGNALWVLGEMSQRGIGQGREERGEGTLLVTVVQRLGAAWRNKRNNLSQQQQALRPSRGLCVGQALRVDRSHSGNGGSGPWSPVGCLDWGSLGWGCGGSLEAANCFHWWTLLLQFLALHIALTSTESLRFPVRGYSPVLRLRTVVRN